MQTEEGPLWLEASSESLVLHDRYILVGDVFHKE